MFKSNIKGHSEMGVYNEKNDLVLPDFFTSPFYGHFSFYSPLISLFKPHCPCSGMGQLDRGYYILYLSFSKAKKSWFQRGWAWE
jgi:hypothetical protein